MALKLELPVGGALTALDAADSWVFAAFTAAVPGEVPVPVGRLCAWNLGADGGGGVAPSAALELRAPGCAFAHSRDISVLEAAAVGGAAPVLFSGAADGLIRLWTADP